ncbi:MAG: MFS transporter [Chloroflexota bacterium]
MTKRQRWTMVAAILGSSIVFLDGTIVNVALPKIGQELPASLFGVLEGQTYVNSGFLAVLAALLILGGAISDRYGRKRVFSIGLIGFGATSVLCGIAPTLEALVVFRLLQGAAAALLVPGSLALITATFDGAARSRAFGVWASATSASTLFAPVLGGLLVQYISWRVAFLINVPLVLVALLGLARGVPESVREGAHGRFDWLGSIDVILVVGGLSFGLIRGQQKAWADPVAWAAIAVGLVAMALFPVLMARRRDPLVPLELFRNRRFAVINLSTFLIYGALYVFLGFSSIFVQGTLGYSVVAASVIGLPVGIILSVASTKVGAVAGRVGPRSFLVAGPLIMAGGLLWFARIPPSTTPWLADFAQPATLVPPASTLIDLLPTMLAFGIGITLVVAPLTSTLMSSIPVARAGLGSAINNAISRVGQPLIGALVFIAITGSFYTEIATATGTRADDPTLRETVSPLNPPPKSASPELAEAVKVASIDAFRLAVLVSAGLLILGAAANGLGLHDVDAMERSPEATGDSPSAA